MEWAVAKPMVAMAVARPRSLKNQVETRVIDTRLKLDSPSSRIAANPINRWVGRVTRLIPIVTAPMRTQIRVSIVLEPKRSSRRPMMSRSGAASRDPAVYIPEIVVSDQPSSFLIGPIKPVAT